MTKHMFIRKLRNEYFKTEDIKPGTMSKIQWAGYAMFLEKKLNEHL